MIMRTWGYSALMRMLKTMAQAALAVIGTDMTGILDVDWVAVLSVSALAGVLSLLTSIKGLPEVKEAPVADFEEDVADLNEEEVKTRANIEKKGV